MIRRWLAAFRRPPAAQWLWNVAMAEQLCRYCDRSASGVLRRITGEPSSWIPYCRAHLGLAVQALGLRARRSR